MTLAAQVHRLEQAFVHIQQARMQGLPFLNPALHVEGVGFVPWQVGVLGVLITPWFMNLTLLPGNANWGNLKVGAKSTHAFASGCYEFIVGHEPVVGFHQMCSLFSPVFEFVDHAAAVATATAVMQCLMDGANREQLGPGPSLSGTAATPAAAASGPMLDDRLARPLSRRALLRLGPSDTQA